MIVSKTYCCYKPPILLLDNSCRTRYYIHIFECLNMYREIFDTQANTYKALANPKRLEIIHLLRDQELSVSQMMEMLGLPQPNLSQHLQVLRDHNIVSARRNGKSIYYKLAHKDIIKASDLLRTILIEQYKGQGIAKELRLKMKDLVPVVRDPICGMRLSPKTAAYAVRDKGKTVYICASGCMSKYEKQKNKAKNR